MSRTPGLAPQPKELGPNGGRLCRGCHKEMPKGFRAWCSEACRIDKMVRAGWHVRFHVWERDKGVCAICRADSWKAERISTYLQSSGCWKGKHWRTAPRCEEGALLIRTAWRRDSWDTSSLWEADHVVPVSEGGGGCGLDGYRTLCRPCHLDETKALRARLAAARRASA